MLAKSNTSFLKRMALAAVIVSLCACSTLIFRPMQPLTQPMSRIDIRITPKMQATTLLVMLPGAYDSANDFIEQGFVPMAQNLHAGADITLLDAHIAYYTNQQIVERLRDEVINPAKAKGYQHIWLVGISLGGYGSLLYSMRSGLNIDGIFIMAPFMGSRHLPAQVAKAGGIRHWTPDFLIPEKSSLPTPALDIDEELWLWLKRYSEKENAARHPRIYLGYGLQDRFTASNQLLAEVLPASQVIRVEGGHTWQPWLTLWQQFLNIKPWDLKPVGPTTAP